MIVILKGKFTKKELNTKIIKQQILNKNKILIRIDLLMRFTYEYRASHRFLTQLTDIVVRVSFESDSDSLTEERAEALPGWTRQRYVHTRPLW